MVEVVVKEELIYTSSSGLTHIYRGRYYHWPAVIKEVTHLSEESLAFSYSEAAAQSVLHHQNICKLYDHYQTPASLTHTLVLEPMDSDLEREIEARKIDDRHWDESLLWWHLAWMVDALAYAQEQGVAHRDVSPENLFFSADRYMKIGDFGNAKISSMTSTVSLRVPKIPYFASPELKRQLQQQSAAPTAYNPYKSDVYSLGLVFLNMAMLQKEQGLMFLEELEEKTVSVVRELQVSEYIKKVLREMLKVADRPDFLQLRAMVNETYQEMIAQPSPSLPPTSPTVDILQTEGCPDADTIDLETLQLMLGQPDMTREALESVFLYNFKCTFSLSMTCKACQKVFAIGLGREANDSALRFCCIECERGKIVNVVEPIRIPRPGSRPGARIFRPRNSRLPRKSGARFAKKGGIPTTRKLGTMAKTSGTPSHSASKKQLASNP